jgi:hypothetical protein
MAGDQRHSAVNMAFGLGVGAEAEAGCSSSSVAFSGSLAPDFSDCNDCVSPTGAGASLWPESMCCDDARR